MTEEIVQGIRDGTLKVFSCVKAPGYASSTIYYYSKPITITSKSDGSSNINVDHKTLKRKYSSVAEEVHGDGAPSEPLVESQQSECRAKTSNKDFIMEEVKAKRPKLSTKPPRNLSEMNVNLRNDEKSMEKKNSDASTILEESFVPLKTKNLNSSTESTVVVAVDKKIENSSLNLKAVMKEPGKKTCFKQMSTIKKNIRIACKETYLSALEQEQDAQLKQLRQLANRLVNLENESFKPFTIIKKIAEMERVPIHWKKIGSTQTGLYSGSILLALVNCIGKAARVKVTCVALEKLLLPNFYITQISPNQFEFHSSGEMALICRNDTSLIQPSKRKANQTKFNPTQFSELSKLIICIESASEPLYNVLYNSARSCNMLLEFEVKREDKMFHFTLKIGTCVVAKASGIKYYEAKEKTAVEAITKLQDICWGILRKPEVSCAQYLSKTCLEIQAKSANSGYEMIHENSVSGDGLGNHESKKPVQRTGRQIIGHRVASGNDYCLPFQNKGSTTTGSTTTGTTNFRDLAKSYLKVFSTKVSQDDVVLSSPEFSSSQLKIIQEECKHYKNIKISRGKKGLSLSKIRLVHELFECLKLNGGETQRFLLIPPTPADASFLDDVSVTKVSCRTLRIHPLPETSDEFKARLDFILEKLKKSLTLNKLLVPLELKSEARTVHFLSQKHRLIVKAKNKNLAFVVRKPRGKELKI